MSEAKLQRLALADDLFPDLLSGKKTDTLRWNEGPVTLGFLEFYAAGNIAQRATVLVTGVKPGPLSAFTRHYQMTIDGLLEKIRRHYPTITAQDHVMLVEFMSPQETEKLIS